MIYNANNMYSVCFGNLHIKIFRECLRETLFYTAVVLIKYHQERRFDDVRMAHGLLSDIRAIPKQRVYFTVDATDWCNRCGNNIRVFTRFFLLGGFYALRSNAYSEWYDRHFTFNNQLKANIRTPRVPHLRRFISSRLQLSIANDFRFASLLIYFYAKRSFLFSEGVEPNVCLSLLIMTRVANW